MPDNPTLPATGQFLVYQDEMAQQQAQGQYAQYHQHPTDQKARSGSDFNHFAKQLTDDNPGRTT